MRRPAVSEQRDHLRYGGLEADEEGARHDGMTDVVLLDLDHLEEREDVLVVQAMSRSDRHAEAFGELGAVAQTVNFGGLLSRPGLRELTGVKLDDGGADLLGELDLLR